MKYLMFVPLSFFLFVSTLSGQLKVDSGFAFQSNPNKKFALYIPSNYDETKPNKAVLALHPYNTRRWDASTWRDKLVEFAEMNDLLLICPDGDADGKIDDPIDTAFTSALLDSVMRWYNINAKKLFIMGFSWGGRTTYTYGLRRAGRFAGFIPMSPAINGTGLFRSFLPNAKGKPFYLICGSLDAPNQRFYAPLNALKAAGAIVNDSLLAGVGHTVDYAGSTRMFDIAFDWVDSVDTRITTRTLSPSSSGIPLLYPNPAKAHQSIHFDKGTFPVNTRFIVTSIDGKKSWILKLNKESAMQGFSTGSYLLTPLNKGKALPAVLLNVIR